MSTKPEKLETLQQTWKDAYRRYGKGSQEELKAYQDYIQAKQAGKRKGKTRDYLKKGR
jgi:hypothetical protein